MSLNTRGVQIPNGSKNPDDEQIPKGISYSFQKLRIGNLQIEPRRGFSIIF
jgi:hypothetical protein